MGEKITVKQLAKMRGADPNFLLGKLREVGLPQKSLDDLIDSADTDKIIESLGKRRKTLSKKSFQTERMRGKSNFGRKGKPSPAKPKNEKDRIPRPTTGKHSTQVKTSPGKTSTEQEKTAQGKKHPGERPQEAKHKKKTFPEVQPKYEKKSHETKAPRADFKSKSPKSKTSVQPDKASQRYGVRISEEEAEEIEEVIRDQKVRDPLNLRLSAVKDRPPVSDKNVEINNPHKFVKPTKQPTKVVSIEGDMSFAELARELAVKKTILLNRLRRMGAVDTDEQDSNEIIIDKEMATLVAEELNYKVNLTASEQDIYKDAFKLPDDAKLESRPPVVTIMGHVDHGKTTLLDYIRKSKLADDEAGKITQHFGAYSVSIGDNKICFFDTPGHAAFSEMRARGAKLTDIVVLVVAADDGMKPQTVEAIKHAQSANAEIVVAINKMDAQNANPEQVRKDLAGQGLQPEDWGGEVQFIEISAKTGKGVDKLLDALLAQTSIMELKGAVGVPGRGYVVESKLARGIGPSATIILNHGEAQKGDIIMAGEYYGRIKLMRDDIDNQIKSAGPGLPFEVLGLNGVPLAGDACLIVNSEKEARRLIEANQKPSKSNPAPDAVDLEELLNAEEVENIKINIIIKADVTGSLEAIKGMVAGLSSEGTEFVIVSQGVGAVSESDVGLARATDAIIIGFNVRLDGQAKQEMRRTPVPEVHYYNVIYELADQLDKVLNDNIAMKDTEKIVGIALVKDVFSAKQFGQIAGCEVSEGTVYKNKPIRVLRDNKVIYEGVLESLRRFKENVKEVQQGVECGVGVKDYKNVKVGDQIEVYDKLDTTS